LNDEGQQKMVRAWPKLGVAQQEAPEESNIEDEGDDQPQVTYKLVQFYFTFNDFLFN
jgi:hypothetical protein